LEISLDSKFSREILWKNSTMCLKVSILALAFFAH
jgi:hypothetical protein